MVEDDEREAELEAAVVEIESRPTDWLEALYVEHAAMVVQTAFRVTGNPADAEDVLQTVFFRLARREALPRFTSGCGAYLRRAATNAALDIVQSRFARSGTSFDAIPDTAFADPTPHPDRRLDGRELARELRRILSELSRRSAEVFVLKYFEGLDNRSIAKLLGTSTGTVAVTLHRARAKIKREMASRMGGAP